MIKHTKQRIIVVYGKNKTVGDHVDYLFFEGRRCSTAKREEQTRKLVFDTTIFVATTIIDRSFSCQTTRRIAQQLHISLAVALSTLFPTLFRSTMVSPFERRGG